MKNLFIEAWFANKSVQSRYGRDLLFISRLYSRFLYNLKIENLLKISIEVVDFPGKTNVIPTNKLTKVCLLYRQFDWKMLDSCKEEEKNRILLDFLLDCLVYLSEKFLWPIEDFKKAYNNIIESNFRNEFLLIPQQISNDKRFKASVVANFTKEFISIFLELNDIKYSNETKKIEIIRVVYFKDNFSDVVHKIKWVTNEELFITNKDREINFKVCIQKSTVEIFLTPRIHNESYLQDELKLLNPITSQEECYEINKKRIESI